MTKEVMVTISGLHVTDGEQDDLETVHVGEFYERNGTCYILYEEQLEGISAPVRNRLKIRERSLEVQKRGPVCGTMSFEEGKSRSGSYTVPYGSFVVDIHTDSVQVRREEERLEVTASYRLALNGVRCAECDIRVLAQPRESFRFADA